MVVIAFDGACKNNGKPDCISCGTAVLFRNGDIDNKSTLELASTNQRAELNGCINALTYLLTETEDAVVITDSEYIYNAITKGWYKNWENKGWITASGGPVANIAMWKQIADLISKIEVDWQIFHVKGHIISIGPKTAERIINEQSLGALLYTISTAYVKPEKFLHAHKRFKEINEVEASEYTVRKYVDYNTVVDYVAVHTLQKYLGGM